MGSHLSLQPFFKHSDGLMPQVVIGGDATVGQWLNGAIILEHLWKQKRDKQKRCHVKLIIFQTTN